MIASEDEETQTKGMIILHFNFGPKRVGGTAEAIEAAWKTSPIFSTLPARFLAAHLSFDSSSLGSFNSVLLHAASKFLRLRVRAHQTTPLECHYQLMTFGIPTNDLPMNSEGEYLVENHRAWLEERRRAEEEDVLVNNDAPDGSSLASSSGQQSCGVVPGPKDVLFGRDKFAQDHSGNSHFHLLIDNRREDREMAQTRSEKAKITGEIVIAIQERGGRFLKRDSLGCWSVVVDNVSARYKVANTFRDKRKTQVRRKQKGKASNNKQQQPPHAGGAGVLSREEEDHDAEQELVLAVEKKDKDTHVDPAKRPRLLE